MKNLEQLWYGKSGLSIVLWPLSIVFRTLSAIRRTFYFLGFLPRHAVSAPVIIVGNISVGGVGKTPLVAWLALHLKSKGLRPGIISRGYGGHANRWPQYAREDSDPSAVGDEPILLAKRTQCPVAVAPKRILAAKALLQHTDCDIIISDDGLQHYALDRDLEIAVVDGVRRFGNGYCLPAGPLREPQSRLKSVDFVVCNGLPARGENRMQLAPVRLCNVSDDQYAGEIASLRGSTVHAVAGIGNPNRFFSMLKQNGINVIEHPFPDHHPFAAEDLGFDEKFPIVMTEKDAVKCRGFCPPQCYYVMIDAVLDDNFVKALDEKLQCVLNQKAKATRNSVQLSKT